MVNKETGENIKDIKIKIDPKTKRESFIIKYDKKPIFKELISVKDPRTKKEILINKETGEKQKDLEIKTNEKTGEIKIINKES